VAGAVSLGVCARQACPSWAVELVAVTLVRYLTNSIMCQTALPVSCGLCCEDFKHCVVFALAWLGVIVVVALCSFHMRGRLID